ncbi:MAG: HAD family hydrolase [Parvularculaceae bacterium]
MTGGRIVISMWSGPRNVSTAMMRAFENRADTAVLDEPLYGAYLARTGADHPLAAETLAAYPNDLAEAIAWTSAPPDGAAIAFCKHIAYHYPVDASFDWLDAHRVFLLIRDPRRMVASFARKHDDVAPIVESYRVARRIRAHLSGRAYACPIVDGDDVLAKPEPTLRRLCGALAIPFEPRMLSWPAGPRKSDGPWAAHWYDAVNASTGFAPARPPTPLSADLATAAARAMDDYEALRADRLTA